MDDLDKIIEENWNLWGKNMGMSYRDFSIIFEGGWTAYQSSLTEGV